MNIKQAKQEIIHTVKAYLAKDGHGRYKIPAIRQRPVLLMGPPGIGKTQIMEQVARECQIGLVAYTITHHTRQSAVGLPFIKEETYGGRRTSVTEYTMSEIIASVYQSMESSGLKEGILFIDEINCVSETLAPVMLQFLQRKMFGNQAVPEGWLIVAAGNPPEYNKSAREFDMVTLDRLRCMDLEADYTVWKEYAKDVHIHPAILSYLELRPANFYRVEADVDGQQFVTARGWEDLSNLMEVYEELGIPVTESVVSEFLHHRETAQDVAAYFDLYEKYKDDYGIAEILNGHIRPQVFARIERAAFDERLSVVGLLSDGIGNYIKRAAAEKQRTDLWYTFLTAYRAQLSGGRKQEPEAGGQEVLGQGPGACYQELLRQEAAAYQKECEGNLLSRVQMEDREWLFQQLKKAAPPNGYSDKEAFGYAKKDFRLQVDRLKEMQFAAKNALEYAFDFMEQAFANGQEMVVFVTELAISREAAAFLAEYPCARYLKYNESLLIGTRRQALLSELAEKV